jgi:hypothetical protein
MADGHRHPFATLLGREVAEILVERSAMAGLERVRAVVFADGARFEIPPGNRMRTAGDLAEIRALLAGWPRDAAAGLRARWRDAPDATSVTAIAALLDAWARDPTLAEPSAPVVRLDGSH